MKTRALGLIVLASLSTGCQPQGPTTCAFDYQAEDPMSDPLWANVVESCNYSAIYHHWQSRDVPDLNARKAPVPVKKDPFYMTPECEEALEAAFIIDEESFEKEDAVLSRTNLNRALHTLFFHPAMRTESDLIVQASAKKTGERIEIPFEGVLLKHLEPYSGGIKRELQANDFNRNIRDYFCRSIEAIDYSSDGGFGARIIDDHLSVSKTTGEYSADPLSNLNLGALLYHEMIHGEKNGSHDFCSDGIDDKLIKAALEFPDKKYCDASPGRTYTRQAGYMLGLAVAGMLTYVEDTPLVDDITARSLFWQSCRMVIERSNDLRDKYHGKVNCEQSRDTLYDSIIEDLSN